MTQQQSLGSLVFPEAFTWVALSILRYILFVIISSQIEPSAGRTLLFVEGNRLVKRVDFTFEIQIE